MNTPLTQIILALTCALATTGSASATDATATYEKGSSGSKSPKPAQVVKPTHPVVGKATFKEFTVTKRAPNTATAPVKVEHSGDPHERDNPNGPVRFGWDIKTTVKTRQ